MNEHQELQELEDKELQDIQDNYSFQINTIEGKISAENTYFNNNSEGRLLLGETEFVNQIPDVEYDTSLQRKRMMEERQNIIRLKEEAKIQS